MPDGLNDQSRRNGNLLWTRKCIMRAVFLVFPVYKVVFFRGRNSLWQSINDKCVYTQRYKSNGKKAKTSLRPLSYEQKV